MEPLGQLIRRTEVDDRICIGAFNDERIFKVCQLVGRPLCHSIGVRDLALSFGRMVGVERLFTAGCVQFPVNRKGVSMVTSASVAHAHKLGLQVHAWTINDESTMHNLIDMGVDGIMTTIAPC